MLYCMAIQSLQHSSSLDFVPAKTPNNKVHQTCRPLEIGISAIPSPPQTGHLGFFMKHRFEVEAHQKHDSHNRNANVCLSK
jgi:hypothetical protein